MRNREDTPAYEIISCSARGVAHDLTGATCQDSYGVRMSRRESFCRWGLALSDGHGSAPYFRSRRGADFAVDAQLNTVLNVGWTQGTPFVDDVVARWRAAVAEDLTAVPVTTAEIAALDPRDAVAARLHGVRAYGATLLGAVIDAGSFTCFQLGDGDVVYAAEGGCVALAFPELESSLGDATLSLCTEGASKHAAVRNWEQESAPRLVALCSDGVRNSIVDQGDFLGFFERLLARAPRLGADGLQVAIAEFVGSCAMSGAGDDATIVMLVRADVFESAPAPSAGHDRVTSEAAQAARLSAAVDVPSGFVWRLLSSLRPSSNRFERGESS